MHTATQVESFCESCGTRYAFEPKRPRGRHLVRVGRMVGILPDDADIDSSALVVSRDPFHGAFHFCLECRRFTCPSCWDTDAGFCRSCAMATGATEAEPHSDHAPDPEIEAVLDAALASLLRLGSSDEWLRLDPPPAPRAEIWAAPSELAESPSDDLGPMIEAGLAALGAKALVESERAQAEAEQRRLAEQLRHEEEMLVAAQVEQLRLAQEAEQARQADEARLAWEAEQYRLAQEAEQARGADEARLAWEAEQYRLAQEAEQARGAIVVPSEQLPPPEWAALSSSLGPDVEPSVAVAIAASVAVAPVPAVEPRQTGHEAPPAESFAVPQAVVPQAVVPDAVVPQAVVPQAVVPSIDAYVPVPTPPVIREPLATPPVSPPAPMPAMPPFAPPPPPAPVAWQITAPVVGRSAPWAPPPPAWAPPSQMVASRGGHSRTRSPFAAAPVAGPVRGGVRPCPRCDLPLSGQARFCRRCGLPQS